MTSAGLLVDAFGRIREVVHRLSAASRPSSWPSASTRGEPGRLAGVAPDPDPGRPSGRRLRGRAGLDLPGLGGAIRAAVPPDTGYGHRANDVAAVQLGSGELLVGYHDAAVHEQTTRYVKDLSVADLAHIVDRSWDPPVTLGVRLVSVISDDPQHAGQAALVRGILQRR
jgi:hypothetical protein